MPKYKPTEQDIWDTTPCAICGRDVLEFGAETCSPECQARLEEYEDDYEWMFMQDLIKSWGDEDDGLV
jgi:hypothetical protein